MVILQVVEWRRTVIKESVVLHIYSGDVERMMSLRVVMLVISIGHHLNVWVVPEYIPGVEELYIDIRLREVALQIIRVLSDFCILKPFPLQYMCECTCE